MFVNTDPRKIGYDSNLQVYMQSNNSIYNTIYSGESSTGAFIHNIEGNPIAHNIFHSIKA